MNRLFVAPERLAAGTLVVTGDDHRYLTRALRLTPGTALELFDGEGRVATAELVRIDARQVLLAVQPPRTAPAQRGAQVSVLLALIKGDRTEWAIQKLVELGVAHIAPYLGERGSVRLTGERAQSRRQRYLTVARSAARQCERPTVPTVAEIGDLAAALAATPDDAVRLVAAERNTHERISLRSLEQHSATQPRCHVALLVGPEGGFTDDELSAATTAGFQPISLGPRILRAETAAVTAAAILGYIVGDLG